jgi:LysM repeat protein
MNLIFKKQIIIMREMKKLFILLLSVFYFTNMNSQRISRQEYINKYKDIAIEEMIRTGIPASITLAQALLESDDGNSRLAREANNHFGIKCHNNWDGKKIYHDDDKKGECFRKYNNAQESFEDHSNFLKSAKRYEFLFNYSTDDYKSWAHGLKKSGYATDKYYAERLIKIIEDNNLYIYDNDIGKNKKINISNNHKHEVSVVNNRKYIKANSDDTFESIAKEFDLQKWQIFKYNDLPKTSAIINGQVIFVEPKRNKAARGNEFYIVKEGETMYTIAQKFGVKLNKLYKYNRIEPGKIIEPGQQIWLRKKKPLEKNMKKEEPTTNEKVNIIFED